MSYASIHQLTVNGRAENCMKYLRIRDDSHTLKKKEIPSSKAEEKNKNENKYLRNITK